MSYSQHVAAIGDHQVGEEPHRNIVAAGKGRVATAVVAATAAAMIAAADVDDVAVQGVCHILC